MTLVRVQFNRDILDTAGKPATGAAVEVKFTGTDIRADVYNAAVGGSIQDQPLISIGGKVSGWVIEGTYDFHYSGTLIDARIEKEEIQASRPRMQDAADYDGTPPGAGQAPVFDIATSEFTPMAIELLSRKNQPNGYAGLDASGYVSDPRIQQNADNIVKAFDRMQALYAGSAEFSSVEDAANVAMTENKKLIFGPGTHYVNTGVIPLDSGGLVWEAPWGATIQAAAGLYNPVIWRNTGLPPCKKFWLRGIHIKMDQNARSSIIAASSSAPWTITVESGDGPAFDVPTGISNPQIQVLPVGFGTSTPPFDHASSVSCKVIGGRVGDILTVDKDMHTYVGQEIVMGGRRRAVSLADCSDIYVVDYTAEDCMNSGFHLIDPVDYYFDRWEHIRCSSFGGINSFHVSHVPKLTGEYGLHMPGFIGNGKFVDCEQAGLVFTGGGGEAASPEADVDSDFQAVVYNVRAYNTKNWLDYGVETGSRRKGIVFIQCYSENVGWASGDGTMFASIGGGKPGTSTPVGAQVVAPGGAFAVSSTKGWHNRGTIAVFTSLGDLKALVPYSAHGPSGSPAVDYFTLPGGGTFAVDDTLESLEPYVAQIKWLACIGDCKDAKGSTGINLVGDDITAQGCEITSSWKCIDSDKSSGGKRGEGMQIIGNILKIKCTEPTKAPFYMNIANQMHGKAAFNICRRLSDPTAAGASPGITQQHCNDFPLEFNDVDMPGSDAIKQIDCVRCDVILGELGNIGAQGSVDSAAIAFATDCFNPRIIMPRIVDPNNNARYAALIRIEQRGAADVSIEGLYGVKDKPIVDLQSASRKVNGTQVVADGGDLLMVDVNNILKNGGRFGHGATDQHTYDKVSGLYLKAIHPGGTFIDQDVLNMVANSVIWMDYKSGRNNIPAMVRGGRKVMYGTGPPTNGIYKAGDSVRNPTPVANGVIEWDCVADGNPGTWQAVWLFATPPTVGSLPRVQIFGDVTTITPDLTNYDAGYASVLSAAFTIAAPTGPSSMQPYILRLRSATQQAITWTAGVYRGSDNLALPTLTTGSNKWDYFALRWNAVDGKIDVVGLNQGF